MQEHSYECYCVSETEMNHIWSLSIYFFINQLFLNEKACFSVSYFLVRVKNKPALTLLSSYLFPLVDQHPLNPASVEHRLRNVVCCFLSRRSLFVSLLDKLIGSHTKTAIKARVICLGDRHACAIHKKALN